MKASELIKLLEQAVSEHGDHEVLAENSEFPLNPDDINQALALCAKYEIDWCYCDEEDLRAKLVTVLR
ncbi:hypothetical protein [Vreelandella titanicae]|uniref:hypothetical protein n=1 Tax=Vreelandella titanicae TaxID=664683 RepID=UPI00382B2C8D